MFVKLSHKQRSPSLHFLWCGRDGEKLFFFFAVCCLLSFWVIIDPSGVWVLYLSLLWKNKDLNGSDMWPLMETKKKKINFSFFFPPWRLLPTATINTDWGEVHCGTCHLDYTSFSGNKEWEAANEIACLHGCKAAHSLTHAHKQTHTHTHSQAQTRRTMCHNAHNWRSISWTYKLVGLNWAHSSGLYAIVAEIYVKL